MADRTNVAASELDLAPAHSGRTASKLAPSDVIGPVVLVALMLALLVGARLIADHGNPTGFIVFGRSFVADTHPPQGALIASRDGYDGQFFWVQAHDPLLLHNATVASLHSQAFRLQRMAYPLLADILAAGQPGAIPWTLLAVNVAVVVMVTAAFAVYARGRGWSPWYAILLGLTPGLALSTMRDLSDPLAVAAVLAGLIAFQLKQRWWAAALLSIAVLAREPMMLAVVAVALEGAIWCWTRRGQTGCIRRALHRSWPPVVVPAVAFLGWQAYIDSRYGGNVLSTAQSLTVPFANFVAEARHALRQDAPLEGAWDLCFLTLTLTAMGAGVRLVSRRATAASLAALLFAASLTLLLFSDEWNDTRLSTPLFALVLLVGLEQQDGLAVRVCALGVALTALIPIALGGG